MHDNNSNEKHSAVMEFLSLVKKTYSAESQLRLFLGSNPSRGVLIFQLKKAIHLFTILIKNIYLHFQRKLYFINDLLLFMDLLNGYL